MEALGCSPWPVHCLHRSLKCQETQPISNTELLHAWFSANIETWNHFILPKTFKFCLHLLANVSLEPSMIIPLPYNFRTWPALHLSISAKELWHTGSLFWSLVSLTEKHKHGLGCICDCFSNKDVAPTSSISKFLDLQQLWFLTKGIQHLKFISQMWVNSLKALNVHLQSSTIKAFWHLMHVYVSIPFLVSFAGEPVKISIVFLIWSSFSFRLILWMFSISLIWSGLLHWQLVLQQWHHP